MNCFSHALPFLDDPVLAVGTCIPDWLAACDRKCRASEKKAELFVDHEDPFVASIARGVVWHLSLIHISEPTRPERIS